MHYYSVSAGYIHNQAESSNVKACVIPHGYTRLFYVRVKPEKALPDTRPVTVGVLCTRENGSRCYRRVSLQNGTLGKEIGINRRYNKHISMDYLRHIANIPDGYTITLKEPKCFEADLSVSNTPDSARMESFAKSCAGKRGKALIIAKPNRHPVKDIFLPPDRNARI